MALAYLLLDITAAMVMKACAVWFVLLIVLPFSAPFSTCDLATFYPASSHRRGPAPGNSHHHGPAALDHRAVAPARVHVSMRNRARDMALTLSVEPSPANLAITQGTRTTPSASSIDLSVLTPLRI